MTTDAMPEDHGLYFELSGDTQIVKLSDLTPTKAPEDQPDSVDTAEARMADAARGRINRREPVAVYESADGFTIRDGNATYGVAVRNGWSTLPVVVEAAER